MKININIQEDAQLRKEIRKMIEGQVIAITRDEIKEIVLNSSKNLTPEKLDQIAEAQIKSRVNQVASISTWQPDNKKLEQMARYEVQRHIGEISDKILDISSRLVANTIDERIEQLITKQVEAAVSNRLAKLLGGEK